MVLPFSPERSFVLQAFHLQDYCILAFLKENIPLSPSKSSDRRFCRPEPQACRPVKPCRDSHRLENGVAIFADSEQSSRPLSFLSREGNVLQAFHLQSFCIPAFLQEDIPHPRNLQQHQKATGKIPAAFLSSERKPERFSV